MSKPTRWRPRAVLLDFYGTVVAEDDEPIGRICDRVAEASGSPVTAADVGAYWGQVFGEMCVESFGRSFRPQREIERCSLHRVLERFVADLDADALSEELFDYWVAPQMQSESRSVLSRLDVPVCVVSNIDSADLVAAIDACGVVVEMSVTSEGSRSYKPRPEMFRRALAQLGLPADQVLHVGDSFGSDVRGARAVGIPVLWINRKGRSVPIEGVKPDYIAADLTGLLDVLDGRE